MSMHKLPLSELEEEGLKAHGLSIGTPSQLSDAFRQGIAWVLSQHAEPVANWSCSKCGATSGEACNTNGRFLNEAAPREPATAQDELESFKRWAEVEYNVNPNTEELNLSHIEVKASLKGWQARPAQKVNNVDTPEQQPYGWHWRAIFRGEVVNSGFEVGPHRPNLKDRVEGVTFEYQDVYAAPVAQTAQRSK